MEGAGGGLGGEGGTVLPKVTQMGQCWRDGTITINLLSLTRVALIRVMTC